MRTSKGDANRQLTSDEVSRDGGVPVGLQSIVITGASPKAPLMQASLVAYTAGPKGC